MEKKIIDVSNLRPFWEQIKKKQPIFISFTDDTVEADLIGLYGWYVEDETGSQLMIGTVVSTMVNHKVMKHDNDHGNVYLMDLPSREVWMENPLTSSQYEIIGMEKKNEPYRFMMSQKRPKGWFPMPCKEAREAHNGAWLERGDSENLNLVYTNSSYQSPFLRHCEYKAIDNNGDPVEVVFEVEVEM